MSEALARIKKDLGPEAVIISSYRVPARGWRGLFLRELEVTAALDEKREDRYLAPPAGRASTAGTAADLVRSGSRAPRAGSEAGRRGLVSLPRAEERPVVPGLAGDWRQHLASLQLGEDVVEMVLADEPMLCPAGGDLPRYRLEQRLAAWCQNYCTSSASSRVVVLTGPAGAGKTTTLVKLAARDVLFREEKVAILSLGASPRPGGEATLRYWAGLLGVPFAVAADPEELSRLLAAWGGVQRFYLDTSCDPFYKAGKLLELAGFLSRLQAPEVLLVLGATTRDADVTRAVAQVRRLSCRGLVLTKVDEASSLGPVLNLLPRLALPLQYLGLGREVPDDLYPAGGALLAGLLLGGAGRDREAASGLLAAR